MLFLAMEDIESIQTAVPMEKWGISNQDCSPVISGMLRYPQIRARFNDWCIAAQVQESIYLLDFQNISGHPYTFMILSAKVSNLT